MAIGYHSNELMAAIIANLGTPEGGIAATIEADPIPWPQPDQFPAVFIRFVEMTEEETGHHATQHYDFELFYVMNDSGHSDPRETARQRAEQIAASLMADRRLGVTAFDVMDSLVTRIASDNRLQRELRDREQRKTAVEIGLRVTVAEAR
jgi:hypothetical protein